MVEGPREGEASELGQQSICLVLAFVHTSGYGRRGFAPHAKAWRAMAALWRHCGNGGCSQTLLYGIGSLLMSWPMSWHRFFGEKSWCHCTEEQLPIMGYLLPWPRPYCPDLSWLGRGIRLGRFTENWLLGHVPHSIVGMIVRPFVKLGGIQTVPSHM